MSWFRNHYRCEGCKRSWSDEWSCACDDRCSNCGVDYQPVTSDDLTLVIEPAGLKFEVLRSGDHAEADPCYEVVATFDHHEDARRYLERLTPGEPHPAQLDLVVTA